MNIADRGRTSRTPPNTACPSWIQCLLSRVQRLEEKFARPLDWLGARAPPPSSRKFHVFPPKMPLTAAGSHTDGASCDFLLLFQMEKCAIFGGKSSRLKLKKHALPAIEAVLRQVNLGAIVSVRKQETLTLKSLAFNVIALVIHSLFRYRFQRT